MLFGDLIYETLMKILTLFHLFLLLFKFKLVAVILIFDPVYGNRCVESERVLFTGHFELGMVSDILFIAYLDEWSEQ